MSERERLVELLKQNCHCKDEDCSNCKSNGICFTHRETDYLLENGVIVPPVKVGDTVYQRDSAGRIYEITVTKVIYDTNGIAFDESAIGKTVFLTKEQAEKALKGGAE